MFSKRTQTIEEVKEVLGDLILCIDQYEAIDCAERLCEIFDIPKGDYENGDYKFPWAPTVLETLATDRKPIGLWEGSD